MIVCPDCGNEISDRAEACPKCGFPIQEEKKYKALIEKHFNVGFDPYNAFLGLEQGYVQDVSVDQDIKERINRDFAFISYDDIVSDKFLGRLGDEYIYNPHMIEKKAIDSEYGLKNYAFSRGIYVKKADYDYIKEVLSLFEKYDSTYYGKEFLGKWIETQEFENESEKSRLKEEAEKNIESLKKEIGHLNRSLMISDFSKKTTLDPSLVSKTPTKTSTATLAGAIVAGTTGAVVGATVANDKRNSYQRMIDDYNATQHKYDSEINDYKSKIQDCENDIRFYENILAGNIDVAKIKKDVEFCVMGLKTFLGMIPLIIKGGYQYSEADKECVKEKLLEKSTPLDKKRLNLYADAFLNYNQTNVENDVFTDDALVVMVKEDLEGYEEYNKIRTEILNEWKKHYEKYLEEAKGLIEKGTFILARSKFLRRLQIIDGNNEQLKLLMFLAKKKIKNLDYYIENDILISEDDDYNELIKDVSDNFKEYVEGVNTTVQNNINEQVQKMLNEVKSLYNGAVSERDYNRCIGKLNVISEKDKCSFFTDEITDILRKCNNEISIIQKKEKDKQNEEQKERIRQLIRQEKEKKERNSRKIKIITGIILTLFIIFIAGKVQQAHLLREKTDNYVHDLINSTWSGTNRYGGDILFKNENVCKYLGDDAEWKIVDGETLIIEYKDLFDSKREKTFTIRGDGKMVSTIIENDWTKISDEKGSIHVEYERNTN